MSEPELPAPSDGLAKAPTPAVPALTPHVLWTPPARVRQESRVGDYLSWLERERGLSFADYPRLWDWSVTDLAGFWSSIWDYFQVGEGLPGGSGFQEARLRQSGHRQAGQRDAGHRQSGHRTVLAERRMPGAEWFPGVGLNYAAQVLRAPGLTDDDPVVHAWSQTRPPRRLTVANLREQVRRVAHGLRRAGVRRGDRVVAYAPNLPETFVLLLAAAGLGAVFSACAPEFGTRSVIDRWRQIEPTVLVAIDGYRYADREVDRIAEVAAIRAALPSVRHAVLLPYRRADLTAAEVGWADAGWEALAAPTDAEWEPEPVPFDHPLYVLYSSGTTGLPKPIVHGHGGILLEHLKMLALHHDLGPGDRFLWYTTTGWMMWNYLVSAPAVGAEIVMYDGSPSHPDLGVLWRVAEQAGATYFGASAPYLMACRKAGVEPRELAPGLALRGLGSTGAPLPADGFAWVYERVSPDLRLESLSGGTDLCTGFVGGSPLVPVWSGEISCRCLGAKVEAYDPQGRSVIGQRGELVLTEPMPSMPVGFWGDETGERYRAAYFDAYPGVWRHGDWVTVTERGSCVISGRSDATLNRGGVRLGTAELYAVVEGLPEVADSLAVHLDQAWVDQLLLFVVAAPGSHLDQSMRDRITTAVRTALSPRHVPDQIIQVSEVPRTLSGKKLELPVKRILTGTPPRRAVAQGALANPESLVAYAGLARPPVMWTQEEETPMVLMMNRSSGPVEAGTPLTLDEYLTLPDDTRAEIVDGVLRPMVRANKKGRRVQRRLATLIESRLPSRLGVEEEEVVVFKATPPTARIPDVAVFWAAADPSGESNFTNAPDVLLAVEVVSPGTQTADRYEKPGEYARNGIPSFWRIELEPSIEVNVYNLVNGVYRDEGVYTRGGLIKDPLLPWVSIEVNDLLGDYASE